MKRHYFIAMMCLALASIQTLHVWNQRGGTQESTHDNEPQNTRHSSMRHIPGPSHYDTSDRGDIMLERISKHEQTQDKLGGSTLTLARMQELAGQTIKTSSGPPHTAWEQPINEIRESGLSSTEKSTGFLRMMPGLPLAGQLEAAEQLMFEIEDGDMDLLQPLLANTALPRPVLDMVFEDLLNRPSQIHLAASVSILRVPGHPLRDSALDNLRTWTGEDYGEGADEWSQAVDSFLVWEKEHAAYMNESHDNAESAEIVER